MDQIPNKQNMVVKASFSCFLQAPNPAFHVVSALFPAGYACPWHYHDYPLIMYCKEGSYFHETEHATYTCGAGTVVIIPPGTMHRFYLPKNRGAFLSIINIAFNAYIKSDFENFPNTITSLFLPAFFRLANMSRPEMYPLCETSRKTAEEIIDFLSADATVSRKRTAAEHLFSLPEFSLSEKERAFASHTAHTKLRPILLVQSYINENYGKKITAETLCNASLLCRTNFFTYISTYLGIPYSSYMTMIRVIRANHALLHTSFSLSYISDMCGFATCSHMSKCFKKYIGCLPKQQRARQEKHYKDSPRIHLTVDYFLEQNTQISQKN